MTIILQHEVDVTPGSSTQWLKSRGMSYKICKLYKNDPLPELTDFNNLIICGGSMNVDQEEKHSWMKKEKKLIFAAIAEGKMVLGLCLGSQLIAEALGAQVSRMNYSEVGWQKMQITPNEFAGTGALTLPVFQWHSYGFSQVPGAKNFAGNQAWPHQAYTFNKNVVAFQFHPETTMAWAIECAEDKSLPKGEFCQTASQIKEQLAFQEPMQEWFFKILDHFFSSRS
ncbi:MAG: type 1 glutamine amidotransferase [Bdellovibrio sp.]|nr:type 1 glutamine amidotransferase [Bdellovibrio sp.]